MSPHRTNIVAVLLALATGVTWWLGENHPPAGLPRTAAVVVLALAVFKGGLIALEFMELRHAPALWRRVVVGWLLAVVGLIVLASH